MLIFPSLGRVSLGDIRSQSTQGEGARISAQKLHATSILWTNAWNVRRSGSSRISRAYSSCMDGNTPYRRKTYFSVSTCYHCRLCGLRSNIHCFEVIGTLSAQDYALFVNHNRPDGQVTTKCFWKVDNP